MSFGLRYKWQKITGVGVGAVKSNETGKHLESGSCLLRTCVITLAQVMAVTICIAKQVSFEFQRASYEAVCEL